MKAAEYLEGLFSLEGKHIAFTGAAGGIGRELALGLARAGAFMALCDTNAEGLKELQAQIEEEGGNASCHCLNVTEPEQVQKCTKEIAGIHGRIDVLVNCAGINKREGFLDVEESTYDKIMAVNLKGTFLMSQAVAHIMRKQDSGSIINIGSHNTGWVLGGCSVYAATKAGVMSLTKSQAVEWAKYHIRANCISPGHIKTPLTTSTWENPRKSGYLLERNAMGRPGYPEDILGVCILLASDASAYITGCEYRVDGGCIAGGQPWEYDTKYE